MNSFKGQVKLFSPIEEIAEFRKRSGSRDLFLLTLYLWQNL